MRKKELVQQLSPNKAKVSSPNQKQNIPLDNSGMSENQNYYGYGSANKQQPKLNQNHIEYNSKEHISNQNQSQYQSIKNQNAISLNAEAVKTQAVFNNLNAASLNDLILKGQTKNTIGSFWRCIHLCIVFIYSIGAVATSALLVQYFPQDTDLRLELDRTINNWEMEVIEDVEIHVLTPAEKASQSPPSCSTDYKPFLYFNGQDIFAGCNCLVSAYQSLEIFIGECTTTQTTAGCTNISSVFNVGVYWLAGDLTTAFTMCAKRKSGYSYFSKGSVSSCEKQCGGTTNDSIFCVSSSDACPINYLNIGTTGDPAIKNLLSKSIGGGYSLFYSSTGPNAPIVDLRVSKGKGICNDNQINNLYQESNQHILLNKNITYYCSQTDSRFTSISSLVENHLFDVNYFTSAYQSIPKYIISTTEQYNMYTRPIITIESSRRGQDISNIVNLKNNYRQIYDVSMCILYTSSIYLFFIGIVYSIMSAVNIIGKRATFQEQLYAMTSQQGAPPKSIFMKKVWIKVLFTGMQFISLLTAAIITLLYYFELVTLSEGTVGDSQTISLMAGLKNEFFQKILWYILANSIFFLVLFVIEMLALVPICSQKLKQTNQVKISKKYQGNQIKLVANQDQVVSRNTKAIQMAEYQTYNIYGGNGINTTQNPLIQQTGIELDFNSHNKSKVFQDASYIMQKSPNRSLMGNESSFLPDLRQDEINNISHPYEQKHNNFNQTQPNKNQTNNNINNKKSPQMIPTSVSPANWQFEDQMLSPPPSVSVVNNKNIVKGKVLQASPDQVRLDKARNFQSQNNPHNLKLVPQQFGNIENAGAGYESGQNFNKQNSSNFDNNMSGSGLYQIVNNQVYLPNNQQQQQQNNSNLKDQKTNINSFPIQQNYKAPFVPYTQDHKNIYFNNQQLEQKKSLSNQQQDTYESSGRQAANLIGAEYPDNENGIGRIHDNQRFYDKDDQEVDDIEGEEIKMPAYNQKFN